MKASDKQHFFIIGAQRSGTTLLYQLLDNHPEIQMAKPYRPEPKYFLRKGAETISKSAYLDKYFPEIEIQTKCFGEKSTSYYEYPKIAQEIKNFDIDSKVIVILRNPVHRAISNYFFTKNFGLENRTLDQVFIQKLPAPKLSSDISVNPFDYLHRGHYAELIKPYQDIFKNNFKVIIFEELKTSPDKVLKDVISFLNCDVNRIKKSNTLEKVNETKKGVVSDKINTTLKEYFCLKNETLATLLERNVSIWW